MSIVVHSQPMTANTPCTAAWVEGVRVLRAWTSGPGASWAYLEGAGWRRIPVVAEDGRRDALELCLAARTDRLRVTARITEDDVLQLLPTDRAETCPPPRITEALGCSCPAAGGSARAWGTPRYA
jgi:hypothetical protein